MDTTAISDDVIDGFYELFEGRDDVVFIDDGKVRQAKEDPEHWVDAHLKGDGVGSCIGIYPLRDGKECKWICSDLDQDDSAFQANQLAAAWEYYDIQPWIEPSKSKGHHVWVFLDDWTPGVIARRAALYIHHVAGVPADEVNPKQEITDGYGNCVRLPYWAGRDPGRMEIAELEVDLFVRLALGSKADPDVIFMLANRYTPPTPVQPKAPEGWGGQRREGHYPIRDDVLYGEELIKAGNRDNTFFVLAEYLHGSGYPLHEARQVVREKWKYQTEDPTTFPLKEALNKVDRAYGGRK